MSAARKTTGRPTAAMVTMVTGLLVALVAWMLPVNLKSVSPALLRAAGEGTPSVAALGQQLVDAEKIGPAQLVLEAARQAGDPAADKLASSVARLAENQAELVAWGGWDPFLESAFNLNPHAPVSPSTPVLTLLIPERSRTALREYLGNSRSQGVRGVLATHQAEDTGRFVPADRPGGQPLDAMILLTALLYQGDHFSPSLQRELRGLAERAVQTNALGELGSFYLDLLSLSQRLNWVQLGELLRRTRDSTTVGEYAHLARVAPDQLPIIYTAALLAESADQVANYLIKYGKSGAGDVQLALSNGQGAVRQLMLRQVPVSPGGAPALSDAAGLALLHPKLVLMLKYFGYLFGAFLLFRGIDRGFFPQNEKAPLTLPRMQSGVLALVAAGLFIVATEPFLLKAAPLSEYRFRIVLPLLANSSTPSNVTAHQSLAMNTSTIISIGFFAVLQVVTYLFCLRKLAEINRQALSPQMKLRLVENEDNLFDSGLYIGMMGTAAALVMQVLGLIDANLLAAYSSNLFGLVCVALVKIRHVRGFKRQLILDVQTAETRLS